MKLKCRIEITIENRILGISLKSNAPNVFHYFDERFHKEELKFSTYDNESVSSLTV